MEKFFVLILSGWWRFLVSRYPPFFRASVGIPSGPADLMSLRLRTAARTSENLGGSSSSCADGSFGRRCRNAGSVGLFWLRRVLKCSAQCSSIPCLSFATSHSPLCKDSVAPQCIYYSSVRAERENVDWRSGQWRLYTFTPEGWVFLGNYRQTSPAHALHAVLCRGWMKAKERLSAKQQRYNAV